VKRQRNVAGFKVLLLITIRVPFFLSDGDVGLGLPHQSRSKWSVG
jgi:hypothetical protein